MLFDKIDHGADLGRAHKCALHTDGFVHAHRHIQHIAVAQKLFGAAGVENGARINLAHHRQANTAWNIGLDEACNHINRRALGGHNKVHARRARLLGNAADIVLYLFARHHHQICQLVNDNDDIRHFFQAFVHFSQGIVLFNVGHAVFSQQFIAALHLRHCAAQGAGGLARLGHHRHQKMRDAVILRKFHHFRVDQNKAQLFR